MVKDEIGNLQKLISVVGLPTVLLIGLIYGSYDLVIEPLVSVSVNSIKENIKVQATTVKNIEQQTEILKKMAQSVELTRATVVADSHEHKKDLLLDVRDLMEIHEDKACDRSRTTDMLIEKVSTKIDKLG